MLAVGIIAVLIGAVLIYWNIPYSSVHKGFLDRMESRAEKTESTAGICTRAEIEKLPEPLRRYCEYIGLENTPKYQVVRTYFMDTKFIFDDKSGKVLDMDYDLWLFFDRPFRSAYCGSSMYGIPFEGEDYCNENAKEGMVCRRFGIESFCFAFRVCQL